MQSSRLKRLGTFTLLALLFLTVPLSTDTALACSTVAFRSVDRPLLAYNFDFEATGSGYLMINPASVRRTSVTVENPAQWIARYGSVSFNQFGPGMPAAGMNTAGLVITLMWNSEAAYAKTGTASRVSELEFIQRLLDTSGSVAEALTEATQVRIEGLIPIHYFLFDRTGEAAVIKPTPDGTVYYQGPDLPVTALTNTSYPRALAHYQSLGQAAGERSFTDQMSAEDRNSLGRFSQAASATLVQPQPTSAVEAFRVLDQLAHAPTRWQIVFDPAEAKIDLRLKDGLRPIEIELSDLDYSCRSRPLSARLTKSQQETPALNLLPIEQMSIAASVAEVLGSMQPTAALARPEVAQGVAEGLLASSSCQAHD